MRMIITLHKWCRVWTRRCGQGRWRHETSESTFGQDNEGKSNNNNHVRKTKSADELRSCLYDGTSGLVIGNDLPLFVPKSYLYVLPTTNKGRHPWTEKWGVQGPLEEWFTGPDLSFRTYDRLVWRMFYMVNDEGEAGGNSSRHVLKKREMWKRWI